MNALSNEQVKQVKDVAQTSKLTEAIFKMWAHRKRDREAVILDRFKVLLKKEGIEFTDEEFNGAFKALEEKGFGSIVYGRSGSSTVFKPGYSLKSMGRAVTRGRFQKETRNRKKTTKVKSKRESQARTKKGPKPKNVIQLQPRTKENGMEATVTKSGVEIRVRFDNKTDLVNFINAVG